MTHEWEPEFILTKGHPLGRYATVYLDGEKLLRCFEVRASLAAFDRPIFGEVVVGAEPERHVITNKPHLGEFDIDGIWARLKCGKVQIELDEEGKAVFLQLRARGLL